MLECVVDSREQSLWDDLQHQPLSIPTHMRMLDLGDLVIGRQQEEGNDEGGYEVLLMIERKTVRDLVHSLKDGRYHDQRRRWLEFQTHSPHSFVSLWIEGDLMAAEMEETMRSSLVNSLLRLQSRHRILVHHARTRDAFVKSLHMIVDKLKKDPYHLVPPDNDGNSTATSTTTMLTMNQYKKSAHSQEHYWHDCLTLVPGVSAQTAQKIQTLYPTLVSLVQSLQNDPHGTWEQISQIPISEKRKVGNKLAEKILRHIDPSLSSSLDQKK